MRKTFGFLLAGVLASGLFACGSGPSDDDRASAASSQPTPSDSSTSYLKLQRRPPTKQVSTGAASDCTRLTIADYRSIGQGLKAKGNRVIDGYVEDADVTNDFDVTWVYAVRVKVPGGSQDVLISANLQHPSTDSGLLLAYGDAQDLFTWGSQIGDGSSLGNARDDAANSDAADAAIECLAAG